MDPFAVPESAIGTFEHMHGLRVTVHDLGGSLWPFLEADRFYHAMAPCQAVKSRGGLSECLAFELDDLRTRLAGMPDGCIHICHASLVEWVVPVFRSRSLDLILFAGVRSAGRDLRADFQAPISRFAPTGRPAPPVSQVDAMHIMEHLRQLAARLEDCIEALQQAGSSLSSPVRQAPCDVQRAVVIHRFIQERHASHVRLGDLARVLHLSKDRAGHAVHEATGQTFSGLLAAARVRLACSLLRHSALPVTDVALRSGFGDVAHFHRVFRKTVGTTPGRYRRVTGT